MHRGLEALALVRLEDAFWPITLGLATMLSGHKSRILAGRRSMIGTSLEWRRRYEFPEFSLRAD